MTPIAVAIALTIAAPACAEQVERWRPYIDEASARFDVPVDWIERVMRAESGGRARIAGRPTRSVKGAIGLMQLMPETWAELRATLGLGADPDDPRDNILAGTFYLRAMYDRFGYPGCFAAYNAGPGRYREWLAGRRSLPGETVRYLANIGAPASALAVGQSVPPASVFVIHRISDSVDTAVPSASNGATLFALRKAPE
ncbi:lytic transglycosylase domain-containing protein [Sphingomonas koreensis]